LPIISAPHELLESDIYADLQPLLGHCLCMKCEGFNFGGSVKLRVAVFMVAAAERDGLLGPDSILLESSSGNLGIALSVVAASKGLRFTCVTDPRCNRATVRLMRALGTEVVVVGEPHPEGGFLRERLDRVRGMCAADDRLVWLNQYVNEANWMAHYEITAAEISKQFPDLDVLFVGAGTCGTITGCARYFRENGAPVRIIGVDAVGSVIFGGRPAPRLIPGLGASVPPPLFDSSLLDDMIRVCETDTVRMCRLLSSHGYLVGGSTGTVVSGAISWLDRHDPNQRLRSVAIAPDLGERYVDTIYDDPWVIDNFGPDVLRPARPNVHMR